VPLPAGAQVLLGHGSGGRLSADLVRSLFLPRLGDEALDRLTDAAVVEVDGMRIAFTTDAFVVKPLRFPGGDIGTLAVYGTVNDLAMMGARPGFVSLAFIIEEGFELDALAAVVDSAAAAAQTAGVRVVTGDTKVVERGAADGLFVVSAGIGVVPPGVDLAPEHIRAGDALIVSGAVGSHGVAVMSRRAGIDFDVDVGSDSAPLTPLVESLLALASVRCLRDATRGGLATVLCELAGAAGLRFDIDETAVPVIEPVRSACAVLGLDPLYLANEGVFVAAVAPDDAEAALGALRAHPLGAHAAQIGQVSDGDGVHLRTSLGVSRPLRMPAGELLPRIC
jgi:hydrogenase expression/formation protein HypE